jgi:general secretion pathway protein A
LLAAFTREQHRIGTPLVRAAATEVYGRSFNPPWMKFFIGAASAIGVAVLAIGIWLLVRSPAPVPQANAAAAAQQEPVEPPAAAPTQVAAEPAKPALMDIAEVLRAHPEQTSTDAAFDQLFALWGGTFDPAGGRPCDQALKQGLECVYQQGSWGQLRTLNRPAILTLIDDAGSAHQIVVAALNGNAAHIRLPEQQPDVSLDSLSRLWYGDYLVMWRPQVSTIRPLSAGMQGDGVRWLRHTLNTVHGQPNASASDVYDEELVQMVKDFQRRYRLHVDGIAGVQTQIVLDTLANPAGAPLLVTPEATAGASS